jgi:hypothetical protein
MKHTFGRRLRAAGVSFEDRQDLLGHKRMSTRERWATSTSPAAGTRDRRVLYAMSRIPRESFVDRARQKKTQSDGSVPVTMCLSSHDHHPGPKWPSALL